VIIVGQEIWTADGHVIGLGLSEKVPDFLPVVETVRRIHGQGGLAVAVHPYLHLGLGRKARTLPFDAVEGYNAAIGRAGIYNYFARRLARRMGAGVTAGSDTTAPAFLGQGCTEVLAERTEDVLPAIREGRVKLHTRPLPLPFVFILKNFLRIRDLEPCPLHATVCLDCGKSMSVRLFKSVFRCGDCGREERSRVACCNGHYLCRHCSAARIHRRDEMDRYEREARQREEPAG
jgi:predicted RNA-binding Zn-ribbon protein involved in translation (DUF1610 family)